MRKKLTEARKKAGTELEERIVQELRALSMPSVSFMVDIIPLDNENGFDATGGDEIKFPHVREQGRKARLNQQNRVRR